MDYEKQNPGNYRFESLFLFPRGYQFVFKDKMFKVGVNYTFPIVYPDFGIPHTVYFKRVIGNLFYDYGVGKTLSTAYYRSTGMEMKIETYFFKITTPVLLGIRYSYCFDINRSNINSSPWEFFISIGI